MSLSTRLAVKMILFILSNLLLFTMTFGQTISDVTRRADGYVIVYGPNHSQLSTGYIGTQGDDFGFSSCPIVNRRADGYTKVYNEKLMLLASGFAGKLGDTFTVVGCTIVVKRKDGYTITFDRTLKQTKATGY